MAKAPGLYELPLPRAPPAPAAEPAVQSRQRRRWKAPKPALVAAPPEPPLKAPPPGHTVPEPPLVKSDDVPTVVKVKAPPSQPKAMPAAKAGGASSAALGDHGDPAFTDAPPTDLGVQCDIIAFRRTVATQTDRMDID